MPVNPLTLTTELDAVNLMLRAIGESRVLTLEDATHEDAADALELLRHWNMTVQEQGWRFNVREKVLLLRDGSNNILVPAATLKVETTGDSWDVRASYIDGKLFDVTNDTFVWTKDVYVNLTTHYDFAKIPQSARNYIVQCAGLEYIGNDGAASGRAQFSAERKAMALSALRRTESLIRRPNMLTDSYTTAKAMFGRRPFYPAA
jgi:hypothetical protein